MARSVDHAPGDRGLPARAVAAGRALVSVHDDLRAALDTLREAVAAGTSPAVPATLLAHCTAFCAAVTRHHTAEDAGTFPALATEFPEFASVIAELAHDHHLIADILRRVTSLTGAGTTAGAERTLQELDGLAAVLDSHFRWEERRLVAALDAWRHPATTVEALFGETGTSPARASS